MIAMALACEPKLLIADEPTTALDVTVQAQILELLRGSAARPALIMITHDLGVVAGDVRRVKVMYAGRVVERVRRSTLRRAAHPYTLGLLGASRAWTGRAAPLGPIPGSPRTCSSAPARARSAALPVPASRCDRELPLARAEREGQCGRRASPVRRTMPEPPRRGGSR